MRLFNVHFMPRHNFQLRLTCEAHDKLKSCPRCNGRDFHLSNMHDLPYWIGCSCGFTLRNMQAEREAPARKWHGILDHRRAARAVVDLWQQSERKPTKRTKPRKSHV